MKNLNGTLSSPTLIGGAAYDFSATTSRRLGPGQFYQAGPHGAVSCPIPSQGRAVRLRARCTNDSLTLDDQYLIEVVQD